MSVRAERIAARRALVPARVLDLLVENSLLVVLVCLLGAVMLAVAPELLVADSWMTLLSGREIVQHGLPWHEALTVMPKGHQWTDQQWLAQIVFYGIDVLGGLRLAILVDIALVVGTLALAVAASRARGASPRSTLLVAAISVFVAPWSWQLRAQTFALPLFVVVLWLASADAARPHRRIFLTLPIVALWANIHGSVLLGAGLVSLVGILGLGRTALRHADAPGVPRSTALAVAPWICTLASPYSYHLLGYYKLMLVSSPVSRIIVEWQAPKPHGWDLFFFGVAAATVLLAAWQWRRLTLYDLAVLGVTLGGSLRSTRGVIWFTLAVVVLAPHALDGVFPGREVPFRRRLGLATSALAGVAAATALVAVAAQPAQWFEKYWPAAAARAAANAAERVPGASAVFPSDRFADWLLWKEPSLRGRVAYDVRFELLTGAQLDDLVRFKSSRPGWRHVARAYPVLVIDPTDGKKRLNQLARDPGTRTLYRDDKIAVLVRPASP